MKGQKQVREQDEGQVVRLQLAEVLVDTREGLREAVVSVGLQVLMQLLEEERTMLCGPRSRPHPERKATRYGYDSGSVVLGGRKVRVAKPRVRNIHGGEEELPTWKQVTREDPLRARAVEEMLVGVSTRNYERSLEPLGADQESCSTSRSSVSRRFQLHTEKKVQEYFSQTLAETDFPVMMLDGTGLGDHVLVVALGIDASGAKHVLGLREGTTESEQVCRSLLTDLIERGLKVERLRLFVIDGGKGLRKAIRSVFGSWALIQRCQVHKMRNVLEHLPESRRAEVKKVIARAWSADNVEQAQKQLKRLMYEMKGMHPGAASSLAEGLEETLTLLSLAIRGTLARSLTTTNPIENLQGSLKRIARNVKRWRGGSMALRWAGTAFIEAQKKFRRLRGCSNMPQLLAALVAASATSNIANNKQVA